MVYRLTILSKQDHCASRVKKRGLHDRQYIGPLYPCPTLGRGAVSVLVIVPHEAQVPRLRVSSGTTGCARLLSITVSSKSFRGPGLGVFQHPRGRFFSTTALYQYSTVSYTFY